MPPSPIYDAFLASKCKLLNVAASLPSDRAVLNKVRSLVPDEQKSRRGPLWFGAAYEGEGKNRLGLSVFVKRTKSGLDISLTWFPAESDPPKVYGKFDEFAEAFRSPFGAREVDVTASFTYDRTKTISLFKPIEIGDHSQIFDEIIGISGIKRGTQGKVLYKMEISITQSTIDVDVNFVQTSELDKSMPSALLETANKISSLAIKPKESR